MNKEKEYIEPELLKNGEKKSFSEKTSEFGRDYATEKTSEKINEIKKAMFIKGGTLLLPYILGVILFLFIIFGIIFLIFNSPFDWIFAGILVFFLGKGIWNFLKIFNRKK